MENADAWEMRAIAIRTLDITPDQYWRLTPSELGEMFAGYSWKRDRQWDIAGWMTAHMVNMSGKVTKQKVTVDKLLGRRKAMPMRTHDDRYNAFEEIMRRQQELDEKKKLKEKG